jgi:F0F1-type ATP synthase membrane subunit b/b'
MEAFLEKNSIYLVLMIALMLWFAFAAYLFIIDKRLKKIELAITDMQTQSKSD